ncbi:snaclec bothroinsularin subunit beta-like [Tubulanus polymorphus]|uniref:snaclec bothroinsularin subunit beta-like n=1 Tax=Tubulanus polymorphus TaxID=672921 RepID=UPI003DA6B4D8
MGAELLVLSLVIIGAGLSVVTATITCKRYDLTTCYEVRENVLDWDKAEKDCEKDGGYLAVIPDDDRQDFVAGILQSHPQSSYWIGLKKNYNARFEWVNGDESKYRNWRDNADLEMISRSHAYIYNGVLENNQCTWDAIDPEYHQTFYICEFKNGILNVQ